MIKNTMHSKAKYKAYTWLKNYERLITVCEGQATIALSHSEQNLPCMEFAEILGDKIQKTCYWLICGA